MQTFDVFLSSTFEDMDMVRTSIQSTALPELQEYFLLNEASCNLIDLRWGVSKKEELERRVLKRCLQDIENCAKSPFFFVGIIGERYGWSPCRQDIGNTEDKYVDILNLAVNSSWSVTELECQFAERIKGNSKTAYLISSSYRESEDERIPSLVNYVASRGDYIIEYESKSEIPSKLFELMLTLMSAHLNVDGENLDLLTSIERRVETITRKIKLKDLKSTIKNYISYRRNSCHGKLSYSTPEGLTYDRESIIAIELLAIEILLKVKPLKALKLLEQRQGLDILSYTIRDLLGFKNNHLGNCIFALLAFCTPDGLTVFFKIVDTFLSFKRPVFHPA